MEENHIIGDDEQLPDDEVCDICRDGEVYDGNEILFCDKCNVAVHQSCYSVKRIPTGNWFCDVCKVNGNPLMTACELCKFTGGAYKQADSKGLWVHQLCANWQPEVYVVEKGGQTLINISGLDKARMRLKCSHCHVSGGASVQCSYGRCTVAVHPWCCLHDPKGFTKRIVKTPDGDTLWEIFCKAHASAISDPVKPHTKKSAKPQQVRQSFDNGDIEKVESTVSFDKVTRDRSRDSMSKVIILSMDHAIPLKQSNGLGSSSSKSSNQVISSPSRATNGRAVNRTFPIRTMSEWPGQSEGEGMDLDHFWNVISMYHPEDHPPEWLEFMKSGILQDIVTPSAFCMPCLGSSDNEKNITPEEEERLFEGISEKQKEGIYDYDHRSNLRNVTENIIKNFASNVTIDVTESHSNEKESVPDGDDLHLNCFLNDDDFFVKQRFENVISEDIQPINKDGFSNLSVVYDGEKRTSCEFRVKLSSFIDSEKKSITSMDCTEEHDKWVQSYLFHPDSKYQSQVVKEQKAILELTKVEDFLDDKPVALPDKIIIPNDENDEVSRAIRADQESLQKLTEVIRNKLKSFDSLKLDELSDKETEKRLQWEATETRYESQVAWRKMATCMSHGMKDQTPDFNKIVSESLPASWQIQVDGRPTPEQLIEQEQTNEPHEDAVCMICFDGASKESNPILFCDGCNAALHQACYGIFEIPEGDFFCDRCKHVILLTEDSDMKPPPFKILEMVKCCLCPQYHGGIKPTVDGYWVHMCCSLWAKNSIIKDLKTMSPIDLNDLECDITDPCIYCNLNGGYLQHCDCVEENCLNTFHPICAWFAGAHFESAITDITFSGSSRNGLYPSGINVKIYCEKHDTGDKEGRKAQQEQIRKKYSHKIEDQSHLPGRRVTNTAHHRKNKKKEAASAIAQSRVASSINKNQELKVDVYDHKNCAMCCEPFDKSTIHYETLDKIICHGCSMHVHLKCLKEVSPDFEEGSSRFWTCDKCLRFPPEPAPSEGTWPTCEFCPRRGGAYKPMTEDRWTHVFCASNCNGKKLILPNGELDVKLTGKVDKKHKCSLCNRKEGFLKCYNDNCNAYFHPLCAGRSARTYIKSTRDGLMVWCVDHLPYWLHRTMQGVWINCADIEFLRWTLTNAQGLSNLVDNRIKLKRHEAKSSGDLFSARFYKLLEDAKGRSPIDKSDESNNWIFETDDTYDGPEDEQAIAAALRLKKEVVVHPPGEQVNVETSWGEIVTISSNWTIGKQVHAPKKIVVQHAGVDIIKKSTTVEIGEFKDKIKNGFRRQMQSPEFSHEYFQQYRDIEFFQKTLGDHLTKYCKMPSELFSNELAKLGVDVDQNMFPSKRKMKKEQQKEAPVSKKRKESPTKAPPPGRKEKHNYSFLDHDQLVAKLYEAPTLQTFCFSYVESKPDFDNAMDMLGIAEDPVFFDDEWKIYKDDELPLLERRLLDIINQILEYKVPGINNDNNDSSSKKKSKKGTKDMRELAGDFTDIDFAVIPNYHKFVRRLLDLTYIKEKLIKHEYYCLAQFSKDFYELINNARSFSEDATTWKDAEELGRLFNDLKQSSINNPNGYRNERPAIKSVKVFGRQGASSASAQLISCGVCNENYIISNWPSSAWPMELEEGKGRDKTSWHWKCPNCTASAVSSGNFFNTKTKVKVWWLDDEKYYYGIINAYDEASKRYRVLYDDDEWEFINIDHEPVLFLNDTSELAKAPITSKSKNSSISDDKTKNEDKVDDGKRKSSRR